MNYRTSINQNLSLMIPRVFPQWTNEQHIMDVFHKQDIGKVYKVDIIRKPDEPGRHYPIYQAFVYFSAWYDNDIAFYFQQRIYHSEKKQTKVVYDDPWFWVVFENKNQRISQYDSRIIHLEYRLDSVEKKMNAQIQRIEQLLDENKTFIEQFPSMDTRQTYPDDDWLVPGSLTWDEVLGTRC